MTLRDVVVVLGHVRVEQQQRHPADGGDPDVRVQLAAAGQVERDERGRAVLLAQDRERQAVRVEQRVRLHLPRVAGQRLPEVAGPVQQADTHDGHAHVGGALQVVARQDAEAARVLRQHRGDAELRREVGDGGRQLAARRRRLPLVPLRVPQVAVEVVGRRAHPAGEGLVGGERRQAFGAERGEQRHGITPDVGPELWVDAREQLARRRVPGPAKVLGQLVERRELLGEDRADGESADRSHWTKTTHMSERAHIACWDMGSGPRGVVTASLRTSGRGPPQDSFETRRARRASPPYRSIACSGEPVHDSRPDRPNPRPRGLPRRRGRAVAGKSRGRGGGPDRGDGLPRGARRRLRDRGPRRPGRDRPLVGPDGRRLPRPRPLPRSSAARRRGRLVVPGGGMVGPVRRPGCTTQGSRSPRVSTPS